MNRAFENELENLLNRELTKVSWSNTECECYMGESGLMLLQHYSYFMLITLTSYSTFTKMDGRVLLGRFLISKGWFYLCKHGLLSRNKRSTVNKMKI